MKIYILAHLYDNGEKYEDRQEFTNYEYFSSYKKLEERTKEIDFQEGRYLATQLELDTQATKDLWRTEYLRCISQWEQYEMEQMGMDTSSPFNCLHDVDVEILDREFMGQ